MKLTINGRTYDYTSDYSLSNHQKWKVKLQDAYAFEQIGGVKCFVKRFANKPNAWDLLLQIKGKEALNMPNVYDAVIVSENNNTTYYLFTECFTGRTLKEQILANKSFDIKKILPDVLDSLLFIHEQNFWFSDLNEENIFCLDNGRYFLIDVDSAWHQSIRPNSDNTKEGGMPGASQEFANIALEFYREIQGKNSFLYHDIEGKNLNYLQLLGLLAKLDYYNDHRHTNINFKYAKKNFKALHHHLLHKNETYCKNVFTRALNNTLGYGMVLGMGKFITNESAVPQPQEALPSIEYFSANFYNIYKGDSVTLFWEVKNADSVHLYSNSVIGNVTGNSKILTPQTNEIYTLTAKNKLGREVSKTVQIIVAPIPMPAIQVFRADKTKIKKGETVNLSWTVNNANSITLAGKALNPYATTHAISPTKSDVYTLIIKNKQGNEVKQQLNIEVQSSSNFIRIAAFAIGILGSLFGFWQYNVNAQYSSKMLAASDEFSIGHYDNAVALYEQANTISKRVLFGGKQDLSGKIDQAYFEKYKTQGDKLLAEGSILSPITKPDSTSAINAYRRAVQHINNSYVEQRIIFCEKIMTARGERLAENWVKALNAYNEAINYGNSISLNPNTIDIIKQVRNIVEKPKATFQNIRVEHNIYEYGSKGMNIHVKLGTAFLKYKDCTLAVWFYKENGSELLDSNRSYYTSGGQVSNSKTFRPTYEEAVYEDFIIFMPYDELDISNYGSHDLKFMLGVFYGNTLVDNYSDYHSFTYSIN